MMGHAPVGEEKRIAEFGATGFRLSDGVTKTAGDVYPPNFGYCVAFGLRLERRLR
jgi:hypothetical protein